MRRVLILVVLLIALPVGVYLVQQQAFFFGKASGQPASLVIKVNELLPTGPQVWKNLAQGGEERGRPLQPVLNDLKVLSPDYIRIDHIYDFYNIVSRDASGGLVYNWNDLDAYVNDILSVGAKPFFSLSYMPSTLSKGNEVDTPKNWGEWEALMKATVEHYSGRGGKGISGVYYEVWNEPDLFGGFKIKGEKSYLELYDHSVRGIMRAQNTLLFKVGGAATTGFYPNWLKGLMEYVETEGLWLDFFSWHRYTADLDTYEQEVSLAKEIIQPHPRFTDLELIISEMGHESANDKGYDGYFGAIHTLGLVAVLEDKVSRGFSFEIKDGPGPQKLWGRWGILTHEKHGIERKDRFGSFTFLNQMEGRGVSVTGQGSWVKSFAKKDDKKIRVFVVNFDPNGTHTEAVPIKMEGLVDGEYIFKRTDFSGKKKESTITVVGGEWLTIEFFAVNSAAIFEITPR